MPIRDYNFVTGAETATLPTAGTPTDASDLTTKTYVDTAVAAINTLADGKIYVGNVSNAATEVAMSGDVTISNAGVAAIGSGVIVNGDVNASAAIEHSKMATTGTSTASVFSAADGTNSAPSVTFTDDTNTGIYSSASDTMDLIAGTYTGIQVKKSTGAFANIGIGGAASTSDSFPMLAERTNSSAGTIFAVSNPSTDANSSAAFQVSTDAGNVKGDISVFPSSSTVHAYVSAMAVRPTDSALKLSLSGGFDAAGLITTYTGGDLTSTGEVMRFNADKSVQFMQQITTPATPASGSAKLYVKSDDQIYFLNDAGLETNLITAAPTYTPPLITQYTSGSGTFTRTGSPTHLKITILGGGGGGGGASDGSGSAGTTGGSSTWSVAGGAAIVTAAGGTGGAPTSSGGAGGAPTVGGAATAIYSMTGNSGGVGTLTGLDYSPAGHGGTGPFGGGASSGGVGGADGAAGVANSGSGGGGATHAPNATQRYDGGGGGAGAMVVFILTSPSATYDWAVGAGGAGSTGNANNGGAGGSGRITVEEIYQ